MKKLLVWALAILMVFGTLTAIAEETTEDVAGTWYVNQIVINKNAYANVASLGFKMTITLNEDGTGKIVSGDNETTGNCAWRANDDGTMTIMEEAKTPVSMRLENGNLVIGAEDNYYICGRELDTRVSFAEVQTAEKAEEFNGTYVLMYVSGEGFTLPVDNVMEDLRTIGLASTGVTIKDESVELFGMEAQSYDFDGDGALKLVTNDGLEMTNVKIYKVNNDGIAINWLGLTFYAYPAE